MSKHRRKDDSETKHHRKSRHNGGITNEKNISFVPFFQHMAYNILFNDGHMSALQIARNLTDIWIDPDFILVAIQRHINCLHCEVCKLEEACQNISLDKVVTQSLDM
jgi:hypothetical protein